MVASPQTPVIRSSEAAALVDTLYQLAEGRAVDDDLRLSLAGRVDGLGLAGLIPLAPSLAADPARASSFYLVADVAVAEGRHSVLLHIAPVSAAGQALFADAQVIGRMRPGGGREVTVTSIPFSTRDHGNILAYAREVEPRCLPRPQRSLPAIAAGNRHPEISLPAVFAAYEALLRRKGLNLASTSQLSATREMTTDEALAARDGENPTAAGHTRVSIRHLYHAGLWAAVRKGWRNGYSAEADHFIVSGNTGEEICQSVEACKEAIRHAAGYTKFTTDTSRLFELRADSRDPEAWSDSAVNEKFEQLLGREERNWVLDEFSRPFSIEDATYRFSVSEIVRMSVKFGASLKLNEDLYDYILSAKAGCGIGSEFDFEPSLDEAETLTTPQELIFYMHWLRERGRPAQLVPPNLGFKKRQAYPVALATAPHTGIGLREYASHHMWPELLPRVEGSFAGKPLEELAARVAELARVARHFDGTLSVHSGSGKQAEVLQQIGVATGGRVNYKISGELQLQLFDVLSEQPEGSPWQQLYGRMVDRAKQFAAAGAFGAESKLAAHYRTLGKGASLGDAARGRVDGNLFLVFWLGNIVGSRDVHAPDGDRRFFKEKLDELPDGLLAEVRRRNQRYLEWLAAQLFGCGT